LCRAAGLRDVATTLVVAPLRLPSARHYIEFVRASASPLQQILGALEPQAAAAVRDDMEARLAQFATADGWAAPNELVLRKH
jgi:hypothetical protein